MKFSHAFASRAILVIATLCIGQIGYGAAKPLIEMNGGTPTPAFAKAWTKVKAGEYEFTLDTTQEIKKGVTVTPAIVKSSLEGKLGSSHGVKVSPKGADKVTVTYTGDDAKFLDAIAQTKIRAGGDVQLALESSVSDGGIRADIPNRDPNAGEVKLIITEVKGDVVSGKVNMSKVSGISSGMDLKVKVDPKKFKKLKAGRQLIFVPGTSANGAWTVKQADLIK